MINILIKSFNRPYYLDRCIGSIVQNVAGSYTITVLDDGTPEIYLEKIKKNYPQITLLLSGQAEKKRKAIAENLAHGKPIDGFSIPTDLWKDAAQKSEKYILVTEDDVWFTKKINLDIIAGEMSEFRIPLVKLGWLGMEDNTSYVRKKPLSTHLNEATPLKIFTAGKTVMDWFMYNKYKFYTILYKSGIVDNTTRNRYWTLNSILMGLYDKNYWLEIWKDAAGKVDEKQQLRNAAAWFHKNRNAVFAKTSEEVMKTTFKSSATGSYHEYGNDLDINRVNYILNEAWLKDGLNPMENYPDDFSDAYIQTFLDKENHPKAQYAEWKNWSEKFKEQYRKQGAEV